MLDNFDWEDEPNIPLDTEPALWVDKFSSAEEDEIDEVANELWSHRSPYTVFGKEVGKVASLRYV